MPSSSQGILLASLTGTYLLSRLQHLSFSVGLWVLLLLHILAFALWKVVLWPLLFSPLRHLPEPRGASWLNGHAALLPDERSGKPMNDWINQISNDGLIRYRVKLNQERLFVTSPKALSEVLVQKNYDFAKPRSLRQGLGRILGVGLIVAEGDEHKLQRRQLMPAFAYRHIKELYPVFWSKSVELADALDASMSRESFEESQNATLEISQWITRATLDIIGLAGLGEDFGTIRNPDNEICHAYSRVFDDLRPTKSKVKLLVLTVKEMIARMLPFERSDSIAQASEALKNVARRLIQAKRTQKSDEEKLAIKDILSVALDSGVFTDEMMVNQVLTFLAAGHETTATSMTWALLALCRNPEVQEKLREEVRKFLPLTTEQDGPSITAELIDSLPYVHAVCNEVLRLHPPAGLTKRVAVRDTSILGQFVPAGTDVVIVMRAINHSKELWGCDAMEFRPERWLEKNGGGGGSNFSFMTFLHGPRSCIGQGFARAEFASLLAVLVGRFKIELEDPEKNIEIDTGLTSKPKGGLVVRFTKLPGWSQ